MTGLGPSNTDNKSALGGVYFNGSRIPFVACSDNSDTTVNQDQQLFIQEYSIWRFFHYTVESILQMYNDEQFNDE